MLCFNTGSAICWLYDLMAIKFVTIIYFYITILKDADKKEMR